MTYPTDDLTKVYLDAAADSPTQARAELEALVDKVKAMLAATGTGANNALKLDSSGNIPPAVKIQNNVINELKGADIASATTTDIGAATGNFVDITGTTTITGFGTVQAGARRIVQFDGALTLTYSATKMILPGNADITTAAGDVAEFVSLGSGNWICVNYQRDAVSLVPRGALVYANSNQDIPDNANTAIAFNLESYDDASFHDTSTNNERFTIPTGVTRVKLKAQIYISDADYAAITSWNINIFYNGGTYTGMATAQHASDFAGSVRVIHIDGPPVNCTAGDYFHVNAYFNTSAGQAITILGAGYASWFAIEVIK